MEVTARPDQPLKRRDTVEFRQAGAVRRLRRLVDDGVGGAELAGGRAEQQDQILLLSDAPLDNGEEPRVVGVGQDAPTLLPHRRQPTPRGRERVRPQLRLVELHLELARAVPHPRLPALETRQPQLRILRLEHVGDRPGDQGVTFVGMVEQPAGGDDLAANDQRHRGIEHLQREREPDVLGHVDERGQSSHARSHGSIQPGILHPGREIAAKQERPGLVPLGGFGGRQREPCRSSVTDTPQFNGAAVVRLGRGMLRGRSFRRLAVEPPSHLPPAPARAAVHCQKAAQERLDPRV